MEGINDDHYFRIADFIVMISFRQSLRNNMRLLPSFMPFCTQPSDKCFFHLTVEDELKTATKEEREHHIGNFDTGNGHTSVIQLKNGGYQYIIKDINERDCCLLKTNKDFSDCVCALNGNFNMRCFGLNNALMLVFAFAGSLRQTLLVHASLVRCNGNAYAFIAKSGTGKSTQVSMWLRYIKGCDLMNDDNPIVRIIDNKPYIYGSPWSGKTPCYRQVKSPLAAITRIDRAQENTIERLKPVEAFASFLPSCSSMKWDKDIFDAICNNVSKIVELVPIYTLHCLPNEEAAQVCYREVTRSNQE